MSASSNPGERSKRSRALQARSPASTGTISIVQSAAATRSHGLANCARSAAGIDAQEGKAQQQKNGLGKEWPDQRAERRQSDPGHDRDGDGIGAVASEPGQPRRRPIEKSHRGGITAALAAVEGVAYIGLLTVIQEGLAMARTDAIVLGAGIVGTSAALHLAKRGLAVALVRSGAARVRRRPTATPA